MLLIYNEYRKNARQAEILYHERFPDRNSPSRHYFPWLVQHLKNENNADEDANGFIVNEEVEINVLDYVVYDRTASIRELGNQC